MAKVVHQGKVSNRTRGVRVQRERLQRADQAQRGRQARFRAHGAACMPQVHDRNAHQTLHKP